MRSPMTAIEQTPAHKGLSVPAGKTPRMTQRTSGITQDGEAAMIDINEKGSVNHMFSLQRSIQSHEVKREKYWSVYVTRKLCTAMNNL